MAASRSRALPIIVAAVAMACRESTPERSHASRDTVVDTVVQVQAQMLSQASGGISAGEPAAQGPTTDAMPAEPRRQRQITFNAAEMDERGWLVLRQLEAFTGVRLPDGDYWYDAQSGAAGRWGGPAAVLLVPGLPLGGSLPARASGGGDGRLTGIFVNGRELHPDDVRALYAIYGQAWPGRWWVNARGDFGAEGGPALGNLRQAASARGGPWLHGTTGGSGNFWTGGDGNGYVWANDSYSGCSYANDGGGVIC